MRLERNGEEEDVNYVMFPPPPQKKDQKDLKKERGKQFFGQKYNLSLKCSKFRPFFWFGAGGPFGIAFLIRMVLFNSR